MASTRSTPADAEADPPASPVGVAASAREPGNNRPGLGSMRNFPGGPFPRLAAPRRRLSAAPGYSPTLLTRMTFRLLTAPAAPEAGKSLRLTSPVTVTRLPASPAASRPPVMTSS